MEEMEECACLCAVGSTRGRGCPQKRQRPAEMAAADGKRCLQECQGTAETAAAKRKRCLQEFQDPAEKAEANSKPAPAEKHLEEAAATPFCAGSGGTASPMPPPHCSLQDLPVELLVEIFASLPGTDLASLAQACTKFRHILRTDSIWRQRCREEYGVRENLQNPEMIGMSYREVYAKIFPYRHILGLWQLDHCYRRLLTVVVDGLGITAWACRPSFNTHVDDPVEFQPCFRIPLTGSKSASVEPYMDNPYSFFHKCHLQIQKDRFSIQGIKRDHQKDPPSRLRGERGRVLLVEDFLLDNRQTYCRVYLPPSHAGDLIRPGLFQCVYHHDSLKIVMLSFHGKYARVTNITGLDMDTKLEIHLMRRIQQPDGEIFRNFNELSHVK